MPTTLTVASRPASPSPARPQPTGTAGVPAASLATLDLSALTREQASALEQIAGRAISVFANEANNAKLMLRGAAGIRAAARLEYERDSALRLEREARMLERLAHARALAAGREECVAVRVIEALAGRVMA